MMFSIGKFAEKIGVSVQTLRDWEKSGKFKPAYRSKGNHRYYSEEQLNDILQKRNSNKRINIGYVKVSANHQKDDLKRQYELMELFLAKQGKEFKIIEDIGNRLLRFGYELIEEFAKLHNTQIIIINKDEEKTDEEELVEDILNIIHVFSCKLNGKRSHINKRIINELKNDKNL